MEFESPAAPEPTSPAAEPTAMTAADATSAMDFNFNLDVGEDKTMPVPEVATPASLDLSSISLDLDSPEQESSSSEGGGADPKWQEVATKLDLAKAYEEMGDKDGARELLNEVVKEGDSAQQSQAQQMLSSLG